MTCNFHVGQKVVCVDGKRSGKGYGDEIMPVEGQVYTVRRIDVYPDYTGIYVEEIVNLVRPYRSGVKEGSFCPLRFRPIVERKTDISVFTALLTPLPAPSKEVELS